MFEHSASYSATCLFSFNIFNAFSIQDLLPSQFYLWSMKEWLHQFLQKWCIVLMNVSDQTNHNHTPCLGYLLSITSLTETELDTDSDFIFNASLNGSREKAKNTVQKQWSRKVLFILLNEHITMFPLILDKHAGMWMILLMVWLNLMRRIMWKMSNLSSVSNASSVTADDHCWETVSETA